jgi:hypothetical protein
MTTDIHRILQLENRVSVLENNQLLSQMKDNHDELMREANKMLDGLNEVTRLLNEVNELLKEKT